MQDYTFLLNVTDLGYYTKRVSVGTFIRKLTLVNGTMWCLTMDKLHIYNWDGMLLQTVHFFPFADIYCVLPSYHGNILLADWLKGFILANSKGQHLRTISKERFSDCVQYENSIFALNFKYHSVVIIKLNKGHYIQSNELQISEYKVTSKFDHIAVMDSTIYISSYFHEKLFVYSINDSKQSSYGQRGTTGRSRGMEGYMRHNHLCGVDIHSSVLIADTGNRRLQILKSSKEWHAIYLNNIKDRSHGAVVNGQSIWVMNDFGHLLYME